jgi:hypothetical protein
MVGLVNSSGFNAKIETANAFNAFLSMQPGNAYANVRTRFRGGGPIISIRPNVKFILGASPLRGDRAIRSNSSAPCGGLRDFRFYPLRVFSANCCLFMLPVPLRRLFLV